MKYTVFKRKIWILNFGENDMSIIQKSKRVFIVGKTERLINCIQDALTQSDWDAEYVIWAGQQLEKICEQTYDVVVLEICSENSLFVLQEVKKHTCLPVLGMLTRENKRLLEKALEQGMEDFLLGEFHSFELWMRMEILRKRSKSMKSDVCQMRSFSLDKVRRKVFLKAGEEERVVELSHTEYMLLSMFVENENVLLTYKDLYKKVWDTDSLDDVRTVKVHVSNLRKKIDPEEKGIIANIRRAGYIFSDL